ncbi:MAG: hypothetical protein ABR95_04355 [Sphingobacteriales bacterium BACL12 MAG-120813-bin55]|jgi:hydrogenase maturation protease|nr:MAG: hypothetical protein ABR95_04355 [Sphingobacteriales bacterium BACL12 MAG-120813-bin55]
MHKKLLLGIGNASRQDDALGWAFVEQLQAPGWEKQYVYQLQIEDAALIAQYEKVLLVDATEEQLPEGFSIRTCVPRNDSSFTTHSVSPEALLWLCREFFDHTPHVEVLAITGVAWELEDGLTPEGVRHLQRALQALTPLMAGVKAHPAHT